MIRNLLGLILFAAAAGILAFNWETLLSLAQAKNASNMAEKAILAQDWDQAIAIYRRERQSAPGNSAITLKLASLHWRNGDPAEAEAVYRDLLQAQPNNLDAMLGLAELLQQDRARINEAVDILRQALKAHADEPRLLTQLGNLYKTAGEHPGENRSTVKTSLFDQARYYYQLSLKLDPEQFQTLFNLGVAYQHMRNLQGAANSYCKALLLKPDSYEARFNMGLALSELNQLDAAYRELDRSVQILSERKDMGNAQIMARKVQNIKTANYHDSRKKGLTGTPELKFLDDPSCLYHPDETAARQ